MPDKISPTSIASKSRDAARQLREIAAFETHDIPGWGYMQDRFFTEERNTLLDTADTLENELAFEAERYM